MARTPKPYTAKQVKRGDRVIRPMSAFNVWLYRRTGGKLGAKFPVKGSPVCLLTTTGRRSGEPRTVPLIFMEDGPNVVFVASKGGMPNHPLWYLNLQADPRVTVEIGRNERPMVARTATTDEKAELWPRLVAVYSDYETYQARTDRDIPVVICEPA